MMQTIALILSLLCTFVLGFILGMLIAYDIWKGE